MADGRLLTALFPRGGHRRVVGHLDTLRDGRLSGWAWCRAARGQRLLVDIFVNGVFFGQQLAHRFRADLLEQGIGDGYYGFETALTLTHEPVASVEVFALGERRTRLASSLFPAAARPGVSIDTAEDYIRATFGQGSFPEAEADPPAVGGGARADPLYERLFAPSPIPSDPVALGTKLCGYLDHIRVRSNVAFDPTLTQGQYRDYLRWYLETYGGARGRARAPLSAADIAFLNAPEPDASGLTRAQAMLASACDLPAQTAAAGKFLWSAFIAPGLCVEDCLIRDEDVAILSDIVTEEPMPLTRFMVGLIECNPFLRKLSRQKEDDRALLTFAFLLFATRHPHFLMFMHAPALADFLASAPGPSAFDLQWRAMFGAAEEGAASPGVRWRRAIESAGFDLAHRRFRSVAPSGSRLMAAQAVASSDARVDVQIIGPFSRALGIGQSCRRLAAAVQTLDYSTRFCDFSMDHPNERLAGAGATERAGASRVNILHVNLEDIPTLIAYGPDVFSGSRNIAVPYLELTPVSPAQYLGLDLVDEVWAATHFVADAINSHKPASVIGAALGALTARGRSVAREAAYGDLVKPGDFVFLTAGDALSGAERKNPVGAIRAFLMAFPRDCGVRLVIKTHSTRKVASARELAVWRAIREICAQDPRIVLLDRLLSEEEHQALIEGADCFVSLHRAEGLGYHLLEAMYFRVPVITTAYSGPADFCTDRTAFLCGHRLVHVEACQYIRANAGQVWADPDYADAARQMRSVVRDGARRERIVEAAHHVAATDYSIAALGHALDARLHALLKPSRSVL